MPRPVLLLVAILALGGCASAPAERPDDRESAPRASAESLPSRSAGEHWIHDARKRSLAPRVPFWHQPALVAELGLDGAQIEAFDQALRQSRRERSREDRARLDAELALYRALASGDLGAADRANRALARATSRLAALGGELRIAVMARLRPEQRRAVAEFHPGLLRDPWLAARP